MMNFVAIGGSAGGFDALLNLLPELPKDVPFAVGVVLHLPPDKDTDLVRIFAESCKLRVKEAEDKEEVQPGTIYFAPRNYHLLVEPEGLFSLSKDDPVWYSRPSIDVFFESAAIAFKSEVAGIILTGANQDGAAGLKAIRDNGGLCMVQHPQDALFSVMPQAAINAADPQVVANLPEITAKLRGLWNQ